MSRLSATSRARCAAAWAPASLLIVGGAFAAVTAQYAPGDSGRLVALFPPWWPAERAFAAAAGVGAVTGVGGLGVAVGVSSRRPDLAAALRARGALLVFDGRAFPGCFSSKADP